METVYVIVHEYQLAYEQRFRAKQVQGMINRIKREEKYVMQNGPTWVVPPTMPKPTPDLAVRVVGAYRDLCVANQVSTLSKAGYDVEVYGYACLKMV